MRAHLVQYDIVWEDKKANHAIVRDLLGNAGVAHGDLVLLPEMFDTGFSLDVESTHDADRCSAGFLAEIAHELRASVQASVTVKGADGRGRNRALVHSPDGELLAEYDKIHPFTFGREGERFTGGQTVTTYTWMGDALDQKLHVCPAVCYDLRFPELFREGLTLGADAYAIGANWPADRHAHWQALSVARAIENQAYFFAVNRCGADPHLRYLGGSLAIGPQGEILAQADDQTGVLSVTVDPSEVLAWREIFPAWRDRSPALR